MQSDEASRPTKALCASANRLDVDGVGWSTAAGVISGEKAYVTSWRMAAA